MTACATSCRPTQVRRAPADASSREHREHTAFRAHGRRGTTDTLPVLTRITAYEDGRVHSLDVPRPTAFVLPGIRWGRFDTLFTPAYWRAQVWFEELSSGEPIRSGRPTGFALGQTLVEEVAACLLGGYGIPAEVGLAAFARLRDSGILRRPCASASAIRRLLKAPLEVRGRQVHYRFVEQRSRYLAHTLAYLSDSQPPVHSARVFRDWLLVLPGIGYKTASWITRNYLATDDVAILDVHIYRAGLLIRLFTPDQRVERDYLKLEQRFLAFARSLGVSTAVLDAVMWREMRLASAMALRAASTISR